MRCTRCAHPLHFPSEITRELCYDCQDDERRERETEPPELPSGGRVWFWLTALVAVGAVVYMALATTMDAFGWP